MMSMEITILKAREYLGGEYDKRRKEEKIRELC